MGEEVFVRCLVAVPRRGPLDGPKYELNLAKAAFVWLVKAAA
jgi:hypothetical protein